MSLEDTPQQGATEYKLPHRNRFCNKNGRQKRFYIGEEIPLNELPEFFSVSKVPRKIKRRFRRCGRKRLLRHRAPAAADCYPHRKSHGRRQMNDLDETLASMSISEDDTKSWMLTYMVCVYYMTYNIIHCSKYQYAYRVHQGISVYRYFKFPRYTLRAYALLDRGKCSRKCWCNEGLNNDPQK